MKLLFNDYEQQFTSHLRACLSNKSSNQINESAAPSFIHKNPLIRWFFWQRIREAVKLSKNEIRESIMDFGTGSGVLLPYCSKTAQKIYAIDIDISLAEKAKEKFSLKNTEIIEYNGKKIPLLPKSVNFVFALEVLEHVDNPEKMVAEIARVIKDDGCLLFSGPTENLIYKIGRFFSGFNGEYHKTSVKTIQECLEKHFVLEKRKVLYKFLPFYILGLYRRVNGSKG